MPRPNSLAVTALLTALVGLGPISTDLYLPSLPAMAGSFGAGVEHVQLTLSLFLVGFALAQLLYGPMSDRFGRRPALIAGLVVYLLASAACAAAGSIELLIAGRVVQAFGACAGPVVCRAVVRDVHGHGAKGREGAARVLAYMSMATALAPALGPILGGFLEVWFGWRSNFLALTAYGAAGLAATLAMLPETNLLRVPEAMRPARMLATYASLLGHRAYIGFVLCCAFGYSGIFAFISASSYVFVEHFGLAPSLYGFCFAAIVVGYMVGTLIAGRLTRRLGLERMVRLGALTASAGGLTLAALAWGGSDGIAAVLAPMVLFMAGIGMVLPNSIAGAIQPFPAAAGAASALLGFVQMTVAAGVGVALSRAHDGTARPMAAAIAILAVLVLAAHAALVPHNPRGNTL
jgi:DHA1 family bicyclomycin/chloramphenicol resistance-like MFS transporter